MIYHYKTVDQKNTIDQNVMAASTQKEVADYLKSQGLVVLEIYSEKEWQKKARGWVIQSIRFGGIRLIEKISLARHLSIMINAGLSLSESLDILSQDSDNLKFKKILEELKYDLQSGKPLSLSMAKYPDVFDKSFTSMVKAGEVSGKLVDVLEQIAQKLQQDYDLLQKVRAAMIYPAVILCALVLVGLLMLIVVVPKIALVFLRLKVSLPLSTKILLFLSNIFVAKPFISFPLIFLFVIGVVIFVNTSLGKKIFSWIIHHLPIVRKLARFVDLTRFNQSFALLLKSGLPITEALEIAADTISQKQMKQIVISFSQKISEGAELANSFRSQEKYFPVIMVRMISVGEKTGKLDQILQELGQFYQKETEQTLQTIGNLIEPILMFLIGLAIGAMVLAIIGPMYQIVQQLS